MLRDLAENNKQVKFSLPNKQKKSYMKEGF